MFKLSHYKSYYRVLRYIKPYWKHLILVFLTTILFSVFSGFSVYLTIPLIETFFQTEISSTVQSSSVSNLQIEKGTIKNNEIDFLQKLKNVISDVLHKYIMTGTKKDSLFRICIIIVIAYLLKNITGYIQSYFMSYVEHGVIRDLRAVIYSHLNKLSMKYFTNERIGNIISRIMNDITVVNSGISASFSTMVKEPLLVAVYLGISLMISWWLTLLALLVFPFSLFVIAYIGIKIYNQSRAVQENMANITSFLQEKIFGIKIVKAFSMEERENKNFYDLAQKYFKFSIRIGRLNELSSPLTELLGIIAAMMIIWYGGIQVVESHTLKASEFMGFLFIIFQIMPPVKQLSNVNNRIQQSNAAAERIFEILDEPIDIKEIENAVILNKFSNNIEFRDVSFHYVLDQQKILENISFTVKKGEIIAVVGPSGAGKTTLVDLIPRFYDVTEGEIFLDGINVKDYNLKSLRNEIGIVTQESLLFNDTVAANILYGLNHASNEDIINAANTANAHDFIMNMHKGYDTIIGERGLKMSGGQRQRISIARALLKNPSILIFDEATSALDSESEILVQEAINNLMHNRTAFVIAHRLSTVKYSTRIIVIDKGNIVQIGSHDQLIEDESGLYAKLYNLQYFAD
jgi:subfamily B ATP-binding cassette protein MsbA